ncbi:MAG: radical SAM protein, partial [Alphaproteobacteria bacterium]|nr:radical SAM protein [Alphaproteobacteria bacterium]
MSLRTIEALIEAGFATDDHRAELETVAASYAVAVTPAMAALIGRAPESDPIARQFVPSAAELTVSDDERYDPIGDDAFAPVKGIVHRYPDRALLKPTHTCPVYCRFCFRREMVGPDGAGNLSGDELARALAYIRNTPSIWEVIVTGGDPFVLSPRRLGEIVAALDAIDHVRVIRFHTRVPVVDPDRIDPALIRALSARTSVYVALHANHPRELTAAARAACARLIDAGIAMVSQTVLLRGVRGGPGRLDRLAALLRCIPLADQA